MHMKNFFDWASNSMKLVSFHRWLVVFAALELLDFVLVCFSVAKSLLENFWSCKVRGKCQGFTHSMPKGPTYAEEKGLVLSLGLKFAASF